jgi:F0F1-type ATP synthase membrane subunit b/b'
MNEIKNQVANLSVEIASKVIDKEMKKNNNHEDYINKLLEDQSKN